MALMLSNMLTRFCVKSLEDKLLALTISANSQQIRERHKLNPKPKLRNPVWFINKEKKRHDDNITPENQEFLKEVIQDKADLQSPLAKELLSNISSTEWNPSLSRTGVIARKIGIYPMWTKDGKKISTTLLQVLDNHVIKYYSPEQYNPGRPKAVPIKNKRACLLIGAEAADPTTLTKEYCGLFKNSGVLPKKHLARFYISPEAVLPPGTPLNALHFQVGNVIDVRGKTIDRGFQGVMKRHGFSGMPASHGVTKTHRRGGNIGGGGQKARVWPGTKMPGHMGNRHRILRGLKILRINTKFNVLYVTGQAIPGETNSIVTIYDTVLPLRRNKNVPFPAYLSTDEQLAENLYSEDMHMFTDPTIQYHES